MYCPVQFAILSVIIRSFLFHTLILMSYSYMLQIASLLIKKIYQICLYMYVTTFPNKCNIYYFEISKLVHISCRKAGDSSSELRCIKCTEKNYHEQLLDTNTHSVLKLFLTYFQSKANIQTTLTNKRTSIFLVLYRFIPYK